MFTKILPLSPLPVSFHTGVQSGSGSTSTDEWSYARHREVHQATTPISKVQPTKPANAKGAITATGMMPSSVHFVQLNSPLSTCNDLESSAFSSAGSHSIFGSVFGEAQGKVSLIGVRRWIKAQVLMSCSN